MVKPRTRLNTKKSAGDFLRQARRQRRQSIDQIANELRIPPEQLQALEDGEVEIFAAEIYARGAYQKYARYLGLTETVSYHVFLRGLGGIKDRPVLKVPTPTSWLKRVLTPYGVIAAAILTGVLAVAGYLSWQVASFVSLPELVITEPTTGIIEASEVMIGGETEEGVSLFINGENVLLEEGGKFVHRLPLKPGINVVVAEAVGASGRSRIITQNILVPRR